MNLKYKVSWKYEDTSESFLKSHRVTAKKKETKTKASSSAPEGLCQFKLLIWKMSPWVSGICVKKKKQMLKDLQHFPQIACDSRIRLLGWNWSGGQRWLWFVTLHNSDSLWILWVDVRVNGKKCLSQESRAEHMCGRTYASENTQYACKEMYKLANS